MSATGAYCGSRSAESVAFTGMVPWPSAMVFAPSASVKNFRKSATSLGLLVLALPATEMSELTERHGATPFGEGKKGRTVNCTCPPAPSMIDFAAPLGAKKPMILPLLAPLVRASKPAPSAPGWKQPASNILLRYSRVDFHSLDVANLTFPAFRSA